ncbi:MAG: ribosome biogenesis GTPase Der [bacterium]|nr:ribosome biogenesis GTPase Der [bacterium]
MSTNLPTVAVIGRPNVGKSTLFNRILGKREAIVDDQPGVTRDLKFRPTDWNGAAFQIVDTGGIFGSEDDPFTHVIQEQIERAVIDAAALIFVVDGQTGPTPIDHDIADFLRRLGKPVICAINKIDNPAKDEETAALFFELGLDGFYPISSSHGYGIGDLLDAIVDHLPEKHDPAAIPEIPGLAILGRPNVGKSTLLNALCGHERAIVSPIQGTTRDPVDTEIEINGKPYLLIDTAGIRRRGKMSQGLDRYALLRNQAALERCQLAILMIDAVEGLTETDAKVFRLAHEAGKAAMILVNKWDLVEKETNTASDYSKVIRKEIPFLHYAPIEFVSALTKQRVQRVFPNVERILEQYFFRVPTGELNRLMEGILAKNPPPASKGRAPRMYYWTQAAVAPPTFVVFVSDPRAIHFSYERFLMNRLYETFDFTGSPIRLIFRKREQTKK